MDRRSTVPFHPSDYPEKRQGVVDPGTYRIVWYGVLRSFDRDARPFGEELPVEMRVSNEFVVRR